MALIGEMQYLTIGGSTYKIPTTSYTPATTSDIIIGTDTSLKLISPKVLHDSIIYLINNSDLIKY